MAVLLIAGATCSDNTGEPGSSKRMSFSTGEFNRGYKHGQRDAKWSWTETHAGWMWLWMMEGEYRQGYEEGWKAGRERVRLKKRQEQTGP